ncbi:hypothetical protein IJ098_00545 [Candidatus Saccharibacteria bacterium]|nr:hypothetical protein [Candidatus Saccharibacteria bacterium]MBQ8984334.1 hypothetical protein [Candidatus Saccharibacteria bacterium]
MANPNDAVGTNGAFGGRTSVNAFNDVLSAFSGRGIISGWSASPSSGLTINLGGNGNDRDVAIAEDAAGNKTTVNNISQAPVQVTINAAPASNSRIDAIVAYIEDAPSGSGVTDNPDVVNLLVVSGTVASSPVVPDDSTIRSAITSDGASGSTAYYVILASVRISAGTTDVDSTMINVGTKASLNSDIQIPNDSVDTEQIVDGAVTADKIDLASLKFANYSYTEQNTGLVWVDNKPIYKRTWMHQPSGSHISTINLGISNFGILVEADGVWTPDGSNFQPINRNAADQENQQYNVGLGDINGSTCRFTIGSGLQATGTAYITLYYTKSS